MFHRIGFMVLTPLYDAFGWRIVLHHRVGRCTFLSSTKPLQPFRARAERASDEEDSA